MGESGSVAQETISPLEYLDKLCAYALSIGMSYGDYWHGDPKMLNYYIKAEEMRLAKDNQKMWLQGMYVYVAIGSLVPVLNPFSKEKKAKPYLKKPIPITEKEAEEREKEKYNNFINYMMKRVKNGGSK